MPAALGTTIAALAGSVRDSSVSRNLLSRKVQEREQQAWTRSKASHGSSSIPAERYRDADAATEHFSNISHLMEPIMATAFVTGEVLGTPNAKMKELLGKGGPKLFTPWMALQDRLGRSAPRS